MKKWFWTDAAAADESRGLVKLGHGQDKSHD